MDLNAEFEQFVTQKVIGYQQNERKEVTGNVLECTVKLKDGSVRKCWEVKAPLGKPVNLLNLLIEKPQIDLVL